MFAYLLMHYISNPGCRIYLKIFSTHFKFFIISLSHFLSLLKLLTLFLLLVSPFVHSYLFIELRYFIFSVTKSAIPFFMCYSFS
jgi:hypothetical protein